MQLFDVDRSGFNRNFMNYDIFRLIVKYIYINEEEQNIIRFTSDNFYSKSNDIIFFNCNLKFI